MRALELARLVKAMTREQVVTKAMQERISWRQAATILGVTERQVRRIRRRMEQLGLQGLIDRRHQPRKKRISPATVEQLCQLRRDLYRDFSVRHVYQCATEKHGADVSYTKVKSVLLPAWCATTTPSSSTIASFSCLPRLPVCITLAATSPFTSSSTATWA